MDNTTKAVEMTLECTLVAGPGGQRLAEPLELTIYAEPGTPGEAIEAAMFEKFQTNSLTVKGMPLRGLKVGIPPLVDGAILVEDAAQAIRTRVSHRQEGAAPGSGNTGHEGTSTLFLLVNSGPVSGRVVQLRRGRYSVGRTGADIELQDPDMSRHHAVIEVSRTAVTIEDAGSANGITVDGARVSRAVISTESLIKCGGSTLSIIFLGDAASGLKGLDEAGADVREPLRVERANVPAKGMQLAVSVALPVVLGVGMALATGMWWFLAFTSVSAMALLIPVIAGCRSRREFRLAIAESAVRDAERRRKAAPDAAHIMLFAHIMLDAHIMLEQGGARRHPAGTSPEPSRAQADSTGSPGFSPSSPPKLWLRLGSRSARANVCIEPHDPGLRPPDLGMVPLAFDPSSDITALIGPDTRVDGLARFLIMQLAAFPRAAGIPVVVYGPVDRLPLSARFLPDVHLWSDPTAVLAALSNGSPAAGFLFLFTSAPTPDSASDSQRTEAALLEAATIHGWSTIICGGPGRPDISTIIDLTEKDARHRSGSTVETFLPDFLPSDVFDRFCRSAATAVRIPATASVPDRCALSDLLDCGRQAITRRWAASEDDGRLAAPIGKGSSGPVLLDLNHDGPHVLVAGTTGSGKSELLRTLIAALSLMHPPDRINFIFIDFKGGSGLAPLAGLPQCVGMLTDLGQEGLSRSLQSLKAEVRLRERLFAISDVADLQAYRLLRQSALGQSTTDRLPPLPHLVLVIDEFRMLVEEAPAALAELMRMAAIGRSLGLHLVMATQRPQGALTADIRANVTSRIALRVQSDVDSLDILNSRLAAGISVGTPGRAYLARGPAAPEEFQAATLASSLIASPGSQPIVIQAANLALEALGRPRGQEPVPTLLTPSQAGAPLVAAAQSVWDHLGREEPRRPIAPSLPASVAFAQPPEDDLEISIGLGIADLPEEQRLRCMKWRPFRQGHLALVGTASGTGRSCQAVAAALVSHPVESHMYILDANGSFPNATSLPRIGAFARPNEPSRAARILQRLASEMSSRATPANGQDDPPLVLVITGWGSWVSSFRSGPHAWTEDLVHDLIREGTAGGLAVVVSGDRELVGARFFPTLDTHAFFPYGSTEEARFSWPRLPDVASLPGRAVVRGSAAGGQAYVVQFPEPEPDIEWPYTPARPARRRAFNVLPLPGQVTVDELINRRRAELAMPREKVLEAAGDNIWIGVGGDDLKAASLRLARGGSFLALGGAGSGKSTLMRMLPALNPDQLWLRPGSHEDPAEFWAALWRNRSENRDDPRAIMLVDDFDRLPPDCHQYLADLNGMGLAAILTAAFHAPLHGSLLAIQARASGNGLLLAPRRLADGEFFGVRFDVERSPPPGRAVLFRSGQPIPIQLAHP